MAKIISIFNNKGGVGKTTYMYHIAHLLERSGKVVLMVDADSQCNLTAYSLSDNVMEKAWAKDGNSIWRIIEPVFKGIGDIRQRQAVKIKENLYIVPGDIFLSNYEDRLGDTWTKARGGDESSIRIQVAIYRYILWVVEKIDANVVMVDLGPNLGSLNRAVLGVSDYFIVPMSPDLFSIRGTDNLGSKLVTWHDEWEQCNNAWRGQDLKLPKSHPIFLGYVMQQHNVRNNEAGMTKGWKIFGDRIEEAIRINIIDRLQPLNQVYDWGDGKANLGKIPNLHSLIPYSLKARKPVFDCKKKDGLIGAHTTTAKESEKHFETIINRLMQVI